MLNNQNIFFKETNIELQWNNQDLFMDNVSDLHNIMEYFNIRCNEHEDQFKEKDKGHVFKFNFVDNRLFIKNLAIKPVKAHV